MQTVAEPHGMIKIWWNSLRVAGATFTKMYPFTLIYALIVSSTGFFKSPYILFLIVLPVIVLAYTTLLHRMHNYLISRNMKFENDIAFSLKKFPLTIVVAFLGIIFIAIGYTLVIIPGVILSIMFLFYLPLIIFEKRSLKQNFHYTFRLLWGNFFQTFLTLLIPAIIFGGIAFEVDALGHYLLGWEIHAATLPTGTVIMLHYFLRVIFLSIYLPFWFAVLLLQLNNLKIISRIKTPATT